MYKKIVAILMLSFVSMEVPFAAHSSRGIQEITNQHLQWVIEEAAMRWGEPVSDLHTAYADGILIITELPDRMLFKVSLSGSNPIIVSIEDRL
jgi:hypothetical protein